MDRRDTSIDELQNVKKAVDDLVAELRERHAQPGVTKDKRQAIKLILSHIDTHGANLWGHEIHIDPELGGGVRLVDRTNNALEGFYHVMKRGERRRSGRKSLTNDFEHLPAGAALARNLVYDDYVEPLCGTIDELPRAFAQLDAEQRTRRHLVCTDDDDKGRRPSIAIASASLPREDRRLIRSEGMQRKILAAANSRIRRRG